MHFTKGAILLKEVRLSDGNLARIPHGAVWSQRPSSHPSLVPYCNSVLVKIVNDLEDLVIISLILF